MPVITNIEDLRQMARRRVPKAVFDYVDRGSYDEQTLRGNRAAFAEIGLRQRVGWNVENRSTKTTMLGEDVNMPLAIAPTGLTGLNWANGEILGALAAEKAGIPFTLSTMSICSIEDVSAAVSKPFWFQLYVMRDRDFVADLIARAKRAKVSALMLTMDLQIQGQRHMDIRNGLSVPPRMTLSNALDMCKKIPWAMNMLTTKRKTFGNLDGYVKDTTGINNLSQWIAGQFDPTLSWDDVAWVKSLWGGKLIVKGVLDVQDARMAAQVGIDALVVSNHGGRQLDGASPAIRALPKIVEAIGDRTEVWIDGGIQSGQDVFKSIALGATGCLIGKAWLYGLGAMGEAGVSTALEIIRKELDVTMALTGNTDIREVTRDSLQL
ncbi:MAG: alpha-hydroxy-acid oxidizing protein [Polynucleobacter sp.]|jgi:L-lactate dehydrogenase (cytochrome)|nr:alpha-hydroxy-acid oxidizing protein [Polynucleobacter sp.]